MEAILGDRPQRIENSQKVITGHGNDQRKKLILEGVSPPPAQAQVKRENQDSYQEARGEVPESHAVGLGRHPIAIDKRFLHKLKRIIFAIIGGSDGGVEIDASARLRDLAAQIPILIP